MKNSINWKMWKIFKNCQKNVKKKILKNMWKWTSLLQHDFSDHVSPRCALTIKQLKVFLKLESPQTLRRTNEYAREALNSVQQDNCAEGHTRFGAACIVALLLECASEGKSEDYLSTRRQTAMHIHGNMEETGVYTANHNQPRVVVSSSFVPTFQHSHSCILPQQRPEKCLQVLSFLTRTSCKSQSLTIRLLHRRTATTKLQTKLGRFFR